MNEKRTRVIEYKGYTIIQTIEWKKNPHDGDGNVLKTTIKEMPNYSGFAQMIWLRNEQQKEKVQSELDSAKYTIDVKIKEKEGDIFDKLGFKKEVKQEEPTKQDYFERQRIINEQMEMDGNGSILGNPSY